LFKGALSQSAGCLIVFSYMQDEISA